jgi:cardiolipin synthase
VADGPLGSGSGRSPRRRLLGLDRSGSAPAQTRAGEPLRPWTIGYLRAAMIVVFLVAAFAAGGPGGVNWLAIFACCVAGLGDYVDGLAARLTGQYSRLGTLLDPLLDRALVIAGVVVCWHFGLLPRWLLAVLLARELVMLILARLWIAKGRDISINWVGRIAVWPTMLGLFLGLLGVETAGTVSLCVGVALALYASVLYVRTGLGELRLRGGPAEPG